MASRRLVFSLSLALATLAFAPSGRAGAPMPFLLEDRVPATTLAFASIEQLGQWEARTKDTAVGRLVADPEIQAFAKPIGEDLERMMEGMAQGQMGEAGQKGFDLLKQLSELLEGLSGQVAIALVDVREDTPKIAASLDFGEHVGDFLQFLERARAQTAEAGMEVLRTTKDARGKTWFTAGPPGDEQVFLTDLGTAIVASNDRAWVEGVVSTEAAPVPASLGASEDFRKARTRGNVSGPAGWVYANVPRILSLVPMDDEAKRITSAIGLDTVKSFSYSVAFSGDGFLDTFDLYAPGAQHGIVPLLRTKPTTRPLLPLVPREAFYYSESGASDLGTIVPRIRDIVSKVDPRGVREMDEFLAKARATTGVDLEKELLPALTGESADYLSFPAGGGLYPEYVLFMGVRDAAAFEPLFEKAVAGLCGAVTEDGDVVATQRTVEYRGTKMHVVDLHEAKGDDPVPFTPTWAMLRGRLALTLVPHTMKELVLRSAETTAPPGLGGEEDFRALLGVAPRDHGSMGYFDLQALLSLVYDTGVPLAQTLVKKNMIPMPVRIDLAQLPATRTVRPHLRSVGLWFTGDDAGARVSVHAPVPFSGFLVLGIAAAAVVGVQRAGPPELHRSEGEPMPAPGGSEDTELLLEDVADKVLASGRAMGELPPSLESLVGPGKAFPALPTDSWGTSLRYKAVDRSEGVFELRSAGPNRTFGDADDVVAQFEAD